MEAIETVQRILTQDVDKLTEQTYVVDRFESPNNMKCIYEVLQIPADYVMTINVVRKNMLNSFLNSNIEKSRGTIQHKSNIHNNYSHLKHVELLVESEVVKEIKKTNNHYWNDGLLSVVVDTKLKVSIPYMHHQPYYPTKLTNVNGVYFIETLGSRFALIESVEMYYNDNRNDHKMPEVDYKIYKMLNMWSLVQNTFHFTNIARETMNEILQLFVELKELPVTNVEGITKTFNIVKSFYENIVSRDLIAALSFKAIADSCKSTVNGIKYSTVFNKLFANIVSQEDFDKKVLEISQLYVKNMSSMTYNKNPFLIAVLDTLSEAREMKKAVLKRKSTGAFNKIMDDLEFIQIDQNKYPLSYAAVTAGEIPTSTFFRKSGESYFIYNDNWDIWEEILQSHKEVAISIATEASRRTTYEKDIMSYFYFVLHALPEYLERNTGKKWKGIPKLVNSSNELDPPTEGSNGVAKSRSALTPIVDNEKSEVVVPYVSMQISGYQTTYCYGLNYSVLEKGFSFNGNTVTQDVEKNLNGRDNYGLMFYTLTGTAQGRGYPTFLIIFENMDKEKYGQNFRVHFHRTHPMRSKGGDYNPIHNWTKGCYKWMIGNVNYERIIAQQGDLAFVQIDALPEGESSEVNSYDNHCFSEPVRFIPYTKKEKQNILGYVELIDDVVLNHNEHLNREIPKGIYEIRQCRSWEANPKGIWSLRID